MFEFSEKVVLVTGAAGNLGKAVVRQFLLSGATVCAVDHRQGRLEGLRDASSALGKLLLFENMDVTNQEAMQLLAKKVSKKVGNIDVLVNTVGGYTSGEMVHKISKITFERMMTLNVYSFLNVAQAFIPGMIENLSGKIITIGAVASFKGRVKSGAYGAAKSALLRLTESMTGELKPYHIQVNCVIPGVFDTPDNRKAMPNADFEQWVLPTEVAAAILFLSSPSADAITGAAIPVLGS